MFIFTKQQPRDKVVEMSVRQCGVPDPAFFDKDRHGKVGYTGV